MQQMYEPEKRAYDEGYQTIPAYSEYENRQPFEGYAQERHPPQYRSNEWEKQKPISTTEHIQRGLARAMILLMSALLAISLPLLFLSINYLVTVGLDAGGTTHAAIAAIVFAAFVALIALAGLTCSIIQWKLLEKNLSESEKRPPTFVGR